MIEPTKIALPVSVKFPVVITGFLQKEQTDLAKHTPLLRYKYWDYVEEPILDGEEDEDEGGDELAVHGSVISSRSVTPGKIVGSGDDNSASAGSTTAAAPATSTNTTVAGTGTVNNSDSTATPTSSTTLINGLDSLNSNPNIRRKSRSPVPSNSSEQRTRRVRKEFHSAFEAPVKGILHSYLFQIGDQVDNSHQPVVSIIEPCTHSVQYGGLCALCGNSLDEQDYTEFNNTDRAPISMSHDTSGLKVSYNEAERIEKSSSERLLDEKKLILVVDLDQTVIHAAVDPTIGEWMRDEKNPNHASLKDVKTFCLEESLPVPPRIRANASDKPSPPLPTTLCWYYVKLRPGLDSFLKSMAEIYEMHIYTMATKSYAKAIANIIDPDGKYFADRILSRDDSGSLLQKSLKRLFPVSTSMVAIIDDRGDVWKWSNNLIKVVPYNFFVGIGDINSSFLPQRTGIIESYMKKRKSSVGSTATNNMNVDKKDQSDKSINPAIENGDATNHENAIENNNKPISESVSPVESELNSEPEQEPELEAEPEAEPELEPELEPEPVELSPVEQLVAIGGGEDNVELLSVQASERSASLEAQQIERPLAKLQKDLDRKLHHEEATTTSTTSSEEPDTTNNSPETTDSSIDFTQSDHVLNDNDNELQHLENALRRVHSKFYSDYENNKTANLDLTEIIPQLKSKVFDGCVFLFSGIVPLGRNFDTYDIVQWVRSFGAVVVADLIDSVTHVIATSGGTFKVRMAAGHSNIKIVYSDWVYACIAAWERVNETDYLIEVIDPILPADHPSGLSDNHWLKNAPTSASSTQPEESIVEKFRQSLTDGDIDWDEADKELEEFMASDDEDDDGDDSDKDNDNDDTNDNDNDKSNNRKRERSIELSDEPSTKAARLDDLPLHIEGENEHGYYEDDDDDEFAKELENDLM